MEMSLCHILAVDGVQKATRCTIKDGSPTRQMEVHFVGVKREHLDLGLWGPFKLRLFKEEPMRCFKCQQFRHHKATCHKLLCNLQRQTRDKCLHKETQGGTSYNGAMRKLQREPSCMESQMPRTSETDSDRTTPGHNPAKKRKGSYTEEAENLGNCPLSTGNIKNCLLCGNVKGVQKQAPTPKPKREKRPPRERKPTKTVEQPSRPAVEENYRRERKGPAHLVKSTAKAKAKAETKKMVSAQIQTSPVPAPAKETQTPRRERKESVTQTSPLKTPVTKTPATLKEGAYNLSGQQLVVMMQTFATALAAQLNITLHTEEVKNATRATLNASNFLSKINEDKTRRQNKMSISLDAGMNTSMDITDH